jgi:hypothetical protein
MLAKPSIASASWFAFTLGSFFFLLVYYLPIWFQAVKGASAVESGIMSLPLILGLALVSIVSGIAVTLVGYCELLPICVSWETCQQMIDAPFMVASSIFSAVGVGLMTTFEPNTGHAKWIGYQALVNMSHVDWFYSVYGMEKLTSWDLGWHWYGLRNATTSHCRPNRTRAL